MVLHQAICSGGHPWVVETAKVNVIPYDSALPQKPASETPIGNHSSKKVTVVGMGQVGLGCVAAILNQDWVDLDLAIFKMDLLVGWFVWFAGRFFDSSVDDWAYQS